MQATPALHAARDFASRVAAHWPMRTALLFGSQARNTAHAGSDTDVAVLLLGKPGDFVATKLALDDVAYDVLLAHKAPLEAEVARTHSGLIADYKGDQVSTENATWAIEQASNFVAAIRAAFPIGE